MSALPPANEVRDVVLGIFERVRESPAAHYEAERFLAFLTDPPSRSGRRVADTFAGRRRLVRFIHAVQIELGICLTIEEWERGYGLDEFVELATAKIAQPSRGLRLARQRLEEARARQVSDPVKFGILTAPFLLGPALVTPWPVKIGVALLWVAIVVAVTAVVVMDVRYTRRLVQRIEASRPPSS